MKRGIRGLTLAAVMVFTIFTTVFVDASTDLVLVGSINPGVDNVKPASSVVVAGDYAYLGVYNFGFYVIDVSDPSNPISIAAGTAPKSDAYDIYVKNSYLYLADEDGWLVIFDISDPTNPIQLSAMQTSQGHADDVYVQGNYAYVVGGCTPYNWINGYLDVIDISDPSNPTIIGSHTESWPTYFKGIQVVGNYAYVTEWSTGGLKIIDVSDPTNLTLVANFDTLGQSFEIYVAGDHAYLAGWAAGLEIVDVSEPSNPISVGSYDTDGISSGIRVAGNYAYVADREAGLKVIDVSDPTNPFLVDSYDTDGQANELYVLGSYIYLSDGPAGLKILERPVITAVIDIKPGSDPNCFHNDGHGVIPVAILSTTDFDATLVDPLTVVLDGQGVRLVGKGNLQAHVEDVNGDGLDDLVVQIEDLDGTYEEGDTLATLTGNLLDGTPIEGTDSICIVP